MTDELRRILTEWLALAESENPPLYVQTEGLCSFAYYLNREHSIPRVRHGEGYDEELQDMFRAEGLKATFPFDGNFFAYDYDTVKHLNPQRLEWVRRHINE